MEMSTNITPIRQLQSQLESTGLLISSISHGIKGMLTGLDGGIYLVKIGHGKRQPARLEKGWEMVQRNVDRIRNMVLNILYYAKERSPTGRPSPPGARRAKSSGSSNPGAIVHGVELKTDLDRLKRASTRATPKPSESSAPQPCGEFPGRLSSRQEKGRARSHHPA